MTTSCQLQLRVPCSLTGVSWLYNGGSLAVPAIARTVAREGVYKFPPLQL
jgi:hypothetical protein